MNYYVLSFIVIFLVSVVLYLIYYKNETFANFISDNGEEHKPMISHKYLTSPSDKYITSGGVYKQYLDGKYHYLYEFNLPIPHGGDYNKTSGKFIALAGTSKDTLSPVGEFVRTSDGWSRITIDSDEEFKYTQIIYVIDSSEGKLILEGNI